ncbi:MAG: type IV pilus twitching motility protein PilT [Vicinamibacterales bacterium]
MALIDSLLTAIVRADGDALVLHVGDPPTVVTPSGPVELSAQPLTVPAMTGLLTRLLPGDRRRMLAELGAVDMPVTVPPDRGADQFTVVAARSGDDIWIELRRARHPQQPEPVTLPVPARPATGPALSPAPGAPPGPSLPPAATRPGMAPRRASAGVPDEARAVTRTVRIAVPPPPAPPPPEPLSHPGLGGRVQAGAIERLLGEAARRHAAALYVLAGQRPYLRVDGELIRLDEESAPTGAQVEAALLGLVPGDRRAAVAGGQPAEWTFELAGVGRVRCAAFRDDRGAGAVLHLVASRVVPAAELGLAPEIRALVAGRDGLVVVAAPRGGGKSTLAAALVDLVNQSRAAYIVALERRAGVRHGSARSLVSQRALSGDEPADARIARAALGEDPDVLVVDDARSPEVLEVALDAAGAGHLVVLTVTAGSTAAAIRRLQELVPVDRRARACAAMAECLRGVVSQVLVPKAGGGRLAARELLLTTPAVAGLVAEGRWGELPLAVEHGRRHGMFPLNDALTAFVQSGAVDVRDAWRAAADAAGLVRLLESHGVDTSFARHAG